MDCRPPGSSVHGISQTRILEWGAIYFSRRSSWTRDCISLISYIGSQILYHWATRTANYIYLYIILFIFDSGQFSSVAQSCLTPCNPMDCSRPGSSLYGLLQARVLEWGATSFSRGSSRLRDWTQVSCIPGRRFNLWATWEAQVNVISSFWNILLPYSPL